MPQFDNSAFMTALARKDMEAAKALHAVDDGSLEWRIAGANLAFHCGRPVEALRLLEALRQDGCIHPVVPFLAGIIHQGREDYAAGETAYKCSLILRPDWGRAEEALGCCLVNADRYREAVHRLRRAQLLGTASADGQFALGTALIKGGEVEVALPHLRTALNAAGNPSSYYGQLSGILITTLLDDRQNAEGVMAMHRSLGALFEEGVPARSYHTGADDPERRLRIAYIGSNLRDHVLAPYMEPLLRLHDRAHVHVSVYAHVPDPDPDPVTGLLQGLADEWTFIHALSDDEVAGRIADDRIDILIHVMGHWIDNRLPVLARKPAPIQVSYLCQSPTTGLRRVDYIVTDRWLDADGGLAGMASEIPVALPNGFQLTSYDQERPICVEPPLARKRHPTFASFNNPVKISDTTLRLWAAVLRECGTARLLVKGSGLDAPDTAQAFRFRFAAQGGAADRLDFAGWVPGISFLDLYNDVDIVLDTTPFTGGRTTFDAIWMGVPVVTLVGRLPYGRYSYSHLMRVGLAELCAGDEQDYVRIAVELAGAPGRLAEYRRDLRNRLSASSAFDHAEHLAELEGAYRIMWRHYCEAGERPAASAGD
jgi:protein O-GlcNAc transferase